MRFCLRDAGGTGLFVCLRRGPRCGLEEPSAPVGMPRLRTADLAHRRHGDASIEIAADDVVLGGASMATHSNGMSARQLEDQLGVTYKTAWLLAQKLRRSMVDPDRDLLEGVVEVDQTEIPFRAGDASFEPGSAGKILVVGAVEAIDRGAGRPKPRRKGAKYLDTRSGRLRLAVIADNSAKSIEAFVRANVKPGTTLITDGHAAYPGLSGDYRHDPRVVGNMSPNVVLPWSHRAFSLLKRWALGTYHGLRRKHVDAYLDEFVFRYNRRFHRHVSFETVLGLAAHRRQKPIATSSAAARPTKQSFVSTHYL